MGRSVRWLAGGAAILAVCAAVIVGSSLGQEAKEAKPASTGVALVDVKLVFEKLPTFQEQLAELKREVETRDREFKQKMEAFTQKIAEHKKLPPAQQQAGREELEGEQKTLKAWFDEAKQTFLKKESAIYESHFRIVSDEIARQAQKRGISLVIRNNESTLGLGEDGERKAPDQLLKLLNKPILFVRPELDLTNVVIDALTAQ